MYCERQWNDPVCGINMAGSGEGSWPTSIACARGSGWPRATTRRIPRIGIAYSSTSSTRAWIRPGSGGPSNRHSATCSVPSRRPRSGMVVSTRHFRACSRQAGPPELHTGASSRARSTIKTRWRSSRRHTTESAGIPLRRLRRCRARDGWQPEPGHRPSAVHRGRQEWRVSAMTAGRPNAWLAELQR